MAKDTHKLDLNYAGFWNRVAALLIDFSFFVIFMVITDLIVTLSFPEKPLGGILLSASPVQLFFSFLFLLYFPIMVWQYGATLGKMAMKQRVVDYNYQLVNAGKAFLRYFLSYFVSSQLFFLGFLWIAWDKKRQSWHDKIAETYVVAVPEREFFVRRPYFFEKPTIQEAEARTTYLLSLARARRVILLILVIILLAGGIIGVSSYSSYNRARKTGELQLLLKASMETVMIRQRTREAWEKEYSEKTFDQLSSEAWGIHYQIKSLEVDREFRSFRQSLLTTTELFAENSGIIADEGGPLKIEDDKVLKSLRRRDRLSYAALLAAAKQGQLFIAKYRLDKKKYKILYWE